MSMNVYALKGFKVTVTEESALRGYDSDKRLAREMLEIGKVYTVEKTNVENRFTTVFLQEIPGYCFSSVNFEDVVSQSVEDDRKHPDWARIHRETN